MSRSPPHPLSVMSHAEPCVLTPLKPDTHSSRDNLGANTPEDQDKENRILFNGMPGIGAGSNKFDAIAKLNPAVSHAMPEESPRRQNMRPFSPRKHTFQNKGVSFSPCRDQLPPRAWERIPAKPFAARSEGQKIWKRVPLQDIGIDANIQVQESRRDKEAKEDYLRAVKRMKVDAEQKDADDNQQGLEGKSGPGFWATRYAEENIEKGDSPKKKVRSQQHIRQVSEDGQDEHAYDLGLVENACHEEEESKGHRTIENEKRAETPQQMPTIEDVKEADEDLVSAELEDATLDANVAVLQPEGSQSAINTPDSTENGDLAQGPTQIADADAENQGGEMDESQSREARPEDSTVQDVKDQLDSSPVKAPEQVEKDDVIEDEADASNDPNSKSGVPITQKSSTSAAGLPAGNASAASEACLDLFDLSAPGNLSGLDDTRTAKPEAPIPVTDILASMPSPDVNKAALSRATAIFPGAEQEEDTAFLADFLLRAKASKAAREAATTQPSTNEAPPSPNPTGPVKEISPTKHMKVDDKRHDDDVDDLDTEPAKVDEDAEQTVEASASSPLRRSTRAANTRLPRPQVLPPVPQFGPVLPSQNIALPNTIQLKRATGNEFVFNAKPQQTVQMMTRTNTKRNQGNAVHADVRLQQLKTEPSSTTTEVPSQQNTSPAKKRKRTKDEDTKSSRRCRKNVKWQEELVTYREATPTAPETTLAASDGFAAIEAAAQAEALQSVTDSFSIADVPDTSSADAKHSAQEVPATDVDGTEQIKVRRMRKVNVGNVNGTPAPKTRSRSQLQVPAPAEIASESSTATSKPRSGVIAKSKMPLPVSVASTGTSSTASASERKLDGRRRLRVRT